jgi:hypothetical protein
MNDNKFDTSYVDSLLIFCLVSPRTHYTALDNYRQIIINAKFL